jgi:DNA polymerase theta
LWVADQFCGWCYGVQFFVSKKRKPISPGLKSGKSKIAVNNTVEGSPSAKGTLDNCLVTSEDDNNSAKPSYSAGDSRQDAVKRKLALESNNSSKDELKRPSFSEQLVSQTSEAVEAAKKEASLGLSGMGDVAAGDFVKGCSTSAQGVDNSDLKKFAADFLSLYCRYCAMNFGNHFLCASFIDIWLSIFCLL